ncbi:MAG: hypothetical protein QM764_20050 [Chitinophagaceae bacterium]
MRKFLSGNLMLLWCSLFSVSLNAQTNNVADSTLLSASLKNAIDLHNSVLGSGIHLYNGPEDPGYNRLATGHPYFQNDLVQTGSVFYDDTYYTNVSMLYDLVQDDVVILQFLRDSSNYTEDYKKIVRQDLVKNKVTWFTLPGHEFVRLSADSSSMEMQGGFYDRLYNGKVKLYVKRSKLYIEEVKGQNLEKRYQQTDLYYIWKNGKYYNVRTKRSLPAVFGDKRKDMNSFIRANRKRFKKDKDLLFFETTRYYDQLTTK